MSPRRPTRSISGPIILSSVAVALSTALLVGWILVIYRNWEGATWLMVAGILSFATIMTVLVLFSVFLAREILEVRRQTSFIDSVTHELRSPLASLRLCLETQARQGLAPSQSERLREMMLDDVERLSALIDDILEAGRLAQDLEARQIETFDLEAMVHRCVTTTARRHRLDPTGITVEIPPKTILDTDPVALEVSMRNLLDNAIKYSDPPREITLRALRLQSGRLQIEVQDNGVGIPRDQLKRVFERFYRIDDESVRSRRGTGLGLYVAASLVKGVRGRLRAYSDGPGRGTRMVITLPPRILAAAPSSSVDAVPQPAAAAEPDGDQPAPIASPADPTDNAQNAQFSSHEVLSA